MQPASITTALNVCAFAYHFTGKERDAESGLDYFGARYDASNMGRFMSLDWAAKPEAVPYSDLMNPQSLNLYGYVNNNPLSKTDPNGHEICAACKRFINAVRNTIQVKTTVGSGVEVSGGAGGVKVTAGAATKTETTYTPFGNKPTEVKSTVESGLKVKVGTATGELMNKTPIGPGGEGGLKGKDGMSGETANVGVSSDRSITVIGGSVGVGPALGGAEISINADEAKTALQNVGPAINGVLKTVFGNTFNSLSSSSGSAPSIFNLPQPQ